MVVLLIAFQEPPKINLPLFICDSWFKVSKVLGWLATVTPRAGLCLHAFECQVLFLEPATQEPAAQERALPSSGLLG